MLNHICGEPGFNFASSVQNVLMKGSCLPVIGFGPAVVMAPVSVIQTVTGLAMGIIFKIIGRFSNNDNLDNLSRWSFRHAGMGLQHLAIAAGNIVTFGFFGFAGFLTNVILETMWYRMVQRHYENDSTFDYAW